MGIELERCYFILFSWDSVLLSFSLFLILWNGIELNQIESLVG